MLLTESWCSAAPAHEDVSRRCVLKHTPPPVHPAWTVPAAAEAVYDAARVNGGLGCSHTVFVFVAADAFHPMNRDPSDFPPPEIDTREVLVRESFFVVVAVFPPRHRTHSDFPPSGTVAAEVLVGETFFPGRSVLERREKWGRRRKQG